MAILIALPQEKKRKSRARKRQAFFQAFVGTETRNPRGYQVIGMTVWSAYIISSIGRNTSEVEQSTFLQASTKEN